MLSMAPASGRCLCALAANCLCSREVSAGFHTAVCRCRNIYSWYLFQNFPDVIPAVGNHHIIQEHEMLDKNIREVLHTFS
jgi:hypothetical protein